MTNEIYVIIIYRPSQCKLILKTQHTHTSENHESQKKNTSNEEDEQLRLTNESLAIGLEEIKCCGATKEMQLTTTRLWRKCGDRTERYDAKFTTESIELNSSVLFSFVQLLASTLWLFLVLPVFLSLSPFIHFLFKYDRRV